MKLNKLRLELFWVFFKIGLFTFGGGFAMIPLIEREVVCNKKWISQEDMCDILAVSQTFPGAVAINSATFIGFKLYRYSGALLATLGVVLPSFIIITLIASIFSFVIEISVVVAALKAISACVIALLITAAVRVGKESIKDKISPIITVLALILLLVAGIHPIYVVIFGIIASFTIYGIKLLIRKFK
jgi:chromate transporter